MAATVTLIVERDPESGWYVGHIAELPGCHTQAETLPALRDNILEALTAYLAVREEENPWLAVCGSIPADEVDEMEWAIEEGCERIDPQGW